VPESLGEKLRAAREAKGLSLEQMAALTKINASFITALENGRWDLLPGRVYLKPFTKTCAEALGLDPQKMYEKIDGITPEEKKNYVAPASDPTPIAARAKKIDYKLPVVLGSMLIVIVLILITVKTRGFHMLETPKVEVIPAKPFWRREPPKWNKPWERPPLNPEVLTGQRLRLEAKDDIWALVIADQDTVFNGDMPGQTGKTFIADSTFHLSLSRNDKAEAFFNGLKVPAVGVGSKKLYNFLIELPKDDSLGNEAK
jgi:transcriptional regulator with XRE-family HTH domain